MTVIWSLVKHTAKIRSRSKTIHFLCVSVSVARQTEAPFSLSALHFLIGWMEGARECDRGGVWGPSSHYYSEVGQKTRAAMLRTLASLSHSLSPALIHWSKLEMSLFPSQAIAEGIQAFTYIQNKHTGFNSLEASICALRAKQCKLTNCFFSIHNEALNCICFMITSACFKGF